MTANLYDTPKRTEQNLTVRTNKYEAEVIKDCARGIALSVELQTDTKRRAASLRHSRASCPVMLQ